MLVGPHITYEARGRHGRPYALTYSGINVRFYPEGETLPLTLSSRRWSSRTTEVRDDHPHDRGLKVRRNKRVRMRFPVWVELPLESGRRWALQAHTIVVSRAGATLDVDEPIT